MKPGTLIEVTWDDIEITTQWTTRKQAQRVRPPRFKTVGYFLSEDKRALRTVSTVDTNKRKAVNDVSVFPIGAVIRVREL